jgi:hypothetical protein
MFQYRCPIGLELEVVKDYGPVVRDVTAHLQETGYALHPECVECKKHSGRLSLQLHATWKEGHFFLVKCCDHEKVVAGTGRG